MRLTNTYNNAGARQFMPRLNGGRSKAINSGFAQTAQKAIDTLATAAADKSRNAIMVDGFEVNLFRYHTGSIVCTCKDRVSYLPGPSASSDPHQTGLQVVDTGNPEYQSPVGIKSHAVSKVRPDGISDEHNLYKDDLPIQRRDKNPLDTVFDINVSDSPEVNFDDLPMYGAFPSIDTKMCGICGGTGYVDSYKWASGKRYTLLPADADLGAFAEINTTTRPHSVDIRGTNSVTWLVNIPAYFECLDVWRVRDLIAPETNVRLTIDITGTGNGPWLAMSTSVLNPLQGTGGPVIIKATAVGASDDDVTMFTHVDLYLRTSCRPRAQFPQLERDLSPSSLESMINTQFEIDPAVGMLTRQTLIECIGQARLWFVTQISNKQTARGYIFNVTGQVQVIQPAMSLYGMALYPRFAQVNPTSWRGGLLVEPMHGLVDDAWPYDENETDSGNRL